MGVKKLMKVNITSDHRVIYGAQAAEFLRDLAELIETNPQSLTLQIIFIAIGKYKGDPTIALTVRAYFAST